MLIRLLRLWHLLLLNGYLNSSTSSPTAAHLQRTGAQSTLHQTIVVIFIKMSVSPFWHVFLFFCSMFAIPYGIDCVLLLNTYFLAKCRIFLAYIFLHFSSRFDIIFGQKFSLYQNSVCFPMWHIYCYSLAVCLIYHLAKC